MATKVVILGAAGRMGRTLIRCILEEKVPGLELHGAIDLWDAPELGKDAGLMAGSKEAGIKLVNNLEEVGADADVIVDFSSHFGTAGNAPRILGVARRAAPPRGRARHGCPTWPPPRPVRPGRRRAPRSPASTRHPPARPIRKL